ncbi:up-regulator of cell proliferation-like [Rana temporaria]|uniref:up-regulator of cell proliferation-like n=1 Tax=Rana temporaria TaxID=8407 RepID=UPI001AAD426E|nr:up-regulator of cell proliferation-like [Rana temporaria]
MSPAILGICEPDSRGSERMANAGPELLWMRYRSIHTHSGDVWVAGEGLIPCARRWLYKLSLLVLLSHKKSALELFLESLDLGRLSTSKLTLREFLDIGPETLVNTEPSRNVFWCFFQKLFSLNGTARLINSKDLEIADDCQESNVDELFESNDVSSDSINPLDVVCALLHCSDTFLQQEIITKMSMCQFAVPLILPDGDTPDGGTFMLFGLRDIVKRWTPKNLKKAYIEESIVQLRMPVFSFVRLGEYGSSKSKILNQILSLEDQLHDFFLHQDTNGGNVKRKISDGLVEVAWYFPAGRDSDLFHEPITIANLRGELQSSKKQFCFLTKISQIVFIFIENREGENQCFTDINILSENYFFIINIPSSAITQGTFKAFLENLACKVNKNYLFTMSKDNKDTAKKNFDLLSNIFPELKKRILLLNPRMSQERQIARKLQLIIKEKVVIRESLIIFEDLEPVAYEIGIDIDEDCKEISDPKTRAQEITKCVDDVVKYKKETMKLQGDVWKELTKLEKELCQMKKQGSMSGEEYKSQIFMKILDLRTKHNRHELPDGINKFLEALTKLSKTELRFFFKWTKVYLDSISRKSVLQTQQIKEKGLSQNISERNLGIEHFLRELGQFYESEYFLVENKKIDGSQKKCHNVPEIAADLLLNGFPLELIDGDVHNIPLQWITDVLKELNKKMGGGCKIRVISALGVQSTGKSTLLNTMFGLQLPVSSGRCTRGAFMTLLNVKESLWEDLGCQCILVIDTEGLRAPEFSSIDGSSERDNQLATLVIGLSDITIVNISMENATEMKEILQIVVHAFLRLKEIGKKPSCQFVHQNVSDVSAHEKIMREKQLLLEQLDDVTKVAAKMENNTDVTQFCDIIKYDIENHNWYIPGLWHGVPPMASISTGYSEKVNELKMHLLECIKHKAHSDSCTITDFTEWIKSLWNAVKHEKFIFGFRSVLVANAYNQLCMAYSEQEWKFKKEAHSWMIKTENTIKNQISDDQKPGMQVYFYKEINEMLQKQVESIETFLKEYFEKDDKYVTLVLQYRDDFTNSVSLLRDELARSLNNKCTEIIHIQTEKNKIKNIQANYQKRIEKQVSALLEKHRHSERKLSVEELESEFMIMWNKTLQEFNLSGLKRQDIDKMMLEHLRRDMRNKAGYINEKLIELHNLEDYQAQDFMIIPEYFEGPELQAVKNISKEQLWNEATSVALTILARCNSFVTNKIATKEDYNETLCQQLLDIVNEGLKQNIVLKSEFKPLLELDLKLLSLGKAAPKFQKRHDDFIQENDPKLCLEKLKPEYLQIFKEVYMKTDDCRDRAKRFCDKYLKPALIDYVFSNLGKDIVDDILSSEDSMKYGSRIFFQNALLSDLLKKKIFSEYVKYCLQYEIFVIDWITNYITVRYMESARLKKVISTRLSAITRKVKETLEIKSVLRHTTLSESLDEFCQNLKNELVISQNDITLVIFPDTANVQDFCKYVNQCLSDIETQILTELSSLNMEVVLTRTSIKPQDELFNKVFGCGKQCPFCRVPCELGGAEHKEHFASIHRPQGLGQYKYKSSNILCHELCTTDVISITAFENAATKWNPHPFKEYKKIYPEWKIQADSGMKASIYWKYVFKEFNEEFAKEYNASAATLPEDWEKITFQEALESIQSN